VANDLGEKNIVLRHLLRRIFSRREAAQCCSTLVILREAVICNSPLHLIASSSQPYMGEPPTHTEIELRKFF